MEEEIRIAQFPQVRIPEHSSHQLKAVEEEIRLLTTFSGESDREYVIQVIAAEVIYTSPMLQARILLELADGDLRGLLMRARAAGGVSGGGRSSGGFSEGQQCGEQDVGNGFFSNASFEKGGVRITTAGGVEVLHHASTSAEGRDGGTRLQSDVQDARERPFDGLTFARVLDIWLQAMEAVSAVHARGIVHFDLKPENFLCFFHGEGAAGEGAAPHVQIKLADFGVSVQIATGATHVTKVFHRSHGGAARLRGNGEVHPWPRKRFTIMCSPACSVSWV